MPVPPGGDPEEKSEEGGVYAMDDEDLIKELKKWFKEAYSAKKEVLKKRREDWKMLAGHQWEDSDEKVYKDQKRPRLTLNMMLTIMAAVEGEERTNRQEMKFYGTGQEDDQAAFALNRILKWIVEGSLGEFALSKTFRSGAAVGCGWVVPDFDQFDDPDGLILLQSVNDDECFEDPLDDCPVISRSRFFHRVRKMTDDEMEARWPGKSEDLELKCAAAGVGPETDGKGYRDIYSTPNDTTSMKLYDAKKDLWTVTETWWHQIEPGWVVANPATGLLEEKTDAEMEQAKIDHEAKQQEAKMAQLAHVMNPPLPVMTPAGPMTPPPPEVPPPLDAQQRPIKRFYQAFWCYETLLDKSASPLTTLKRFPYVSFRAILDEYLKEWFGIIRSIIDPQKQHNVEQSAIVQLIQLMPKQSWMAPKGAFHNKVEWQEKIAQPGAMLEYNASRGTPTPIKAEPPARHLIDMAMARPQMMRDISGVNVDMMGQRVAGDPGVVMEMRQKAARSVLAPIFDNFRMTKIALGKVLLAYIQTYIPVGRKLRIVGPEGAQAVEMSQDMTIGKYDISVEETNSTVNDRIATLNVMQTTLPQMAKAGITIPPEIIDLLPMPPNVRQAIKRQMSWDMTIAGRLPPPDWQPGMPIPAPGAPAPLGGNGPQTNMVPPPPPEQ